MKYFRGNTVHDVAASSDRTSVHLVNRVGHIGHAPSSDPYLPWKASRIVILPASRISWVARNGLDMTRSKKALGLLHNYNTFVYSRFFNFNILHSFNNKPRVSLYATPLTWVRPSPKQHAYLLFGFTLARANARMLLNAASKRSSAKNAVRTSRSRSPVAGNE